MTLHCMDKQMLISTNGITMHLLLHNLNKSTIILKFNEIFIELKMELVINYMKYRTNVKPNPKHNCLQNIEYPNLFQ